MGGGPQRGGEVRGRRSGSLRTIRAADDDHLDTCADFPADARDRNIPGREEWANSGRAHGASMRSPAPSAAHATPLTIRTAPVPARLLRLRQLGHDPVFYWTIFELESSEKRARLRRLAGHCKCRS